MRLIAENLFGKDVVLPETKLTYRIQSRVSQKAAVEGRDQTYLLPPLSIRMLSLVPGDASDIRDASAETFADVDRRAFRANLFVVIGGVLFTLAGLVALLTLVRLILASRKPTAAADRLVSDGAILRGVGRELSTVQRERESGGWTRTAGGACPRGRADHRHLCPRPARGACGYDRAAAGRRRGFGRPHHRQERLAPNQAHRRLWRSDDAIDGERDQTDSQRPAPGRARGDRRSARVFHRRPVRAAVEGKGERLDDTALDASLAAVKDALGRLKLEQTWVMKRLGRQRQPMLRESRMWSH